MSLWSVVVATWQNGGQVVVLGGGGIFATAIRRAPIEAKRHDQVARDLNEDLRRWVADRDRQLASDLALIAAYANDPDLEGDAVERLIGGLRKPVPEELSQSPAGSLFFSSAHLNWQKEAKERTLREYRDETIRKLRELDAVVGAEGRLCAHWRRRKGVLPPRLCLPIEAQESLMHWRAPAAIPGTTATAAIDDPTRSEPRVKAVEDTRSHS